MIQETNIPILSICIPIYNRLSYLDKQLKRFLEDKDLFLGDVHLFISDNCSSENLRSCVESYEEKGLKLEYHRNETNIGPDKNFELCFRRGRGKYTWLLGSDDIPVRGLIRVIVNQLRCNEYGLFHLGIQPQKDRIQEYTDNNEMAIAVNYWITFMSANIIKTTSYDKLDLSAFRNSNMIQVPVYLNACLSNKINAIYHSERLFEEESENASNGGYNIFKVFVSNLFSIFDIFVNSGKMSVYAFNKIKKIEYKSFLTPYIVFVLLFKRNRNFDTTDGWKILYRHYGNHLYAYVYPIVYMVNFFIKRFRFAK